MLLTVTRNVFSMRLVDPGNSMQICVRRCPTSDVTTWLQARDFATHSNARLCRYDIDPDDYNKQKWISSVGPCPKLPVFKRSDSYSHIFESSSTSFTDVRILVHFTVCNNCMSTSAVDFEISFFVAV